MDKLKLISTSKLISLFLLGISFTFIIGMYIKLFYENNTFIKVKEGQTWEYIYNDENPFKQSDTTHYHILEINGKYAKYLEIERGDTIIRSSKKRYIKYDSKLIK